MRRHTLLRNALPIWLIALNVAMAAAEPYELSILADNPVGYWRFNEPVGSTTAINDGSQGVALNGTYVDVQLGLTSPFPGLGTAIGLSELTSLVDLANNISPWLNQSATFEFWIKTTQAGADGGWKGPAVTGADQNGTGLDVWWGTNEGGNVGVVRGDHAAGALTPSPINDDEWHHLVLTRDAVTGEMQTFLDGGIIPVATTDDLDNIVLTAQYNHLGNTQSLPGQGEKFIGQLDEIAIYDYVLSADRIHAHYLVAQVPEPTSVGLAIVGAASILSWLCSSRRGCYFSR